MIDKCIEAVLLLYNDETLAKIKLFMNSDFFKVVQARNSEIHPDAVSIIERS